MTTAPTLADVCQAIIDCPHRTAPTRAWGIPQIRTTDIKNGRLDLQRARRVSEETYRQWIVRAEPQAGDLILAREAPVGEVGFVPPDQRVCQGQRTVLLRPDPQQVVPRYLLYLLLTPGVRRRMLAQAEGSTTPHLNVADIRRLRLPELPPINEQRRVADLLGAFDDKIELNRLMNATLEATARAIFKSWFVDFDPVRGTATVPEDVRRLFPDRLMGSRIGPVPEGWEVAPLGEHVEVTRGLSYTGDGLADEGRPLHNLNSIREGGGYKEDGIKHYVGEYRQRDRVLPGDVILANTEQGFEHLLIGYPAIVPRSFGDDGLYSHHIYRLRSLDGSPLTPRWLYLLLVGHRMHQQVVGYSNGTTVNMLPKDGIEKQLIAVPPRELVERFDATVVPMFEQQETLVEQSKTLAELRDTLLPQLMSGNIRLKGAL